MYSIADYGLMIADQVRMNAYVEAVKRSVKPGSVVIDLGAGTGIFALLACRLGARKVYAIEPNDAVHLARSLAAANGYADRIEFFQQLSTKVKLPEKADVIISDLRGLLPIFGFHLNSIIDARERMLKDGGVLIPQRDKLFAAPVHAPELYNPYATLWEDHNQGFDLQAARRITVNNWGKGDVNPEQLLAEPEIWTQIDYTRVGGADFSGEMSWQVQQKGTAHGLLVWFDTELFEAAGFSNSPGKSSTLYGSAFFPWEKPVELEIGGRIDVGIRADLVGDDYVWNWKTLVIDQAGSEKASFNQSTFFGIVHSPAQLRKQSDSFVPALNDDGLLDQFILGLMNQERQQKEIAQLVIERFPARFANRRDALTHVAKLSGKYSR